MFEVKNKHSTVRRPWSAWSSFCTAYRWRIFTYPTFTRLDAPRQCSIANRKRPRDVDHSSLVIFYQHPRRLAPLSRVAEGGDGIANQRNWLQATVGTHRFRGLQRALSSDETLANDSPSSWWSAYAFGKVLTYASVTTTAGCLCCHPKGGEFSCWGVTWSVTTAQARKENSLKHGFDGTGWRGLMRWKSARKGIWGGGTVSGLLWS